MNLMNREKRGAEIDSNSTAGWNIVLVSSLKASKHMTKQKVIWPSGFHAAPWREKEQLNSLTQ